MNKNLSIRIIVSLCAINIVFLIAMVVLTSYGPWFNERSAVVASMLWLFSAVPAGLAAVSGIANPPKKSKKNNYRNLLLVLCWTTIIANVLAVATMFMR